MRKSLANKATKIIIIADGCLLLLNWFLQNFVHTS